MGYIIDRSIGSNSKVVPVPGVKLEGEYRRGWKVFTFVLGL